MKSKSLILLLFSFISLAACGQSTAPQMNKILQKDLEKDLSELAGDAFKGRRGGELGEMRASVWVAQKAREAGLEPAGEDGTYFQFFNLKRSRIADRSTISVDGQSLELWKEVWPTNLVETTIEGDIVWLDQIPESNVNLKGKVVAMRIIPPTPMTESWVSLWQYRYTASAIRQQSRELRKHEVAAIIFVADDNVESLMSFTGFHYQEGSYGIEGRESNNSDDVPLILAGKNLEGVFSKAGPISEPTSK